MTLKKKKRLLLTSHSLTYPPSASSFFSHMRFLAIGVIKGTMSVFHAFDSAPHYFNPFSICSGVGPTTISKSFDGVLN